MESLHPPLRSHKIILTIMSVFLVIVLVATNSLSAMPSTPDHPFFGKMKEAGATVTHSESLPKIAGLTAYQVSHPESKVPSIIYLSADGEVVLSGQYMNRDGRDPIATYITQKAISDTPGAVDKINEKLIESGETDVTLKAGENLEVVTPKKTVNQEGDNAWKVLAGSLFFERNSADVEVDRIVYLFIDPNCPRCAEFWPLVKEYSKKNITFRVVPVSFINEDEGMRKIVAMALTQDPYKAMEINESLFSAGGFPPSAEISDEARQMIIMNLELMGQLKVPGTPGIVFQDADGVTKVVQQLNESVLKALVLEPENTAQ